jgi:hypothetical protein
MAQPIAKIRLALGNVGFYDSLTGVRLTKADPEGIIYSGKNTSNIKKAIREGKVVLKEGSLSSLQVEPVLKREIEIDETPKMNIAKNFKATKKEVKPVEKVETPVVSKKQETIENQNQIKKLTVNTVKNKKEEKPDTNNVSENKKEDKKE